MTEYDSIQSIVNEYSRAWNFDTAKTIRGLATALHNARVTTEARLRLDENARLREAFDMAWNNPATEMWVNIYTLYRALKGVE